MHTMTFFLMYDIHFISILLLLMILITMRIKGDMYNTSGRLFRLIVIFNIYMLALEVLSWQFDQKPGQFNWYANYITNMLFAWSGPIMTCLWFSYIDYHIYGSYKRLKKHHFFMYPMLIITLFIIINFFIPFIFSVSSNNIYAREPFMWLIVLVNSMIVIYKWVDAYKHRFSIDREVVIAVLIYVILPSIGAVLQVVVFGAFIIWPLMAITIVITYFYLDTISTTRDYLTKLYTRQRIESTAKYYIANKRPFTLVIIDLDGFKSINDQYGHTNGDLALTLFSHQLSMHVKKDASVGRFGGDEFVLILPPTPEIMVEKNMQQFQNKLDSLLNLPFHLSFSYGTYSWTSESPLDYEELLKAADQLMYKAKKLRRTNLLG